MKLEPMAPDYPDTGISAAPALEPSGALDAHREGVKAIAVSSNGRWKASADTSRRIVIWDGDEPALKYDPLSILERVYGNRRVYALGFSNDSYLLYVGMTDRLAAYHSESGRRVWQYRGPRVLAFLPSSPVGLAVNPITETLAAAFDDGHVGFWLPDGRNREFWFDNDAPRQLAFSRDGTRLIGTDSFSICIWDAHTHAKIARHTPNERVHALALSPMADVAASRTLYDITIWQIDSGAESAKIEIGRGLPLLAFSPKHEQLAFSEVHRVRISDFQGQILGEVAIEDANVISLAFAADGSKLLVGCSDGSIRRFEAPKPGQFRV